MKRRSSGLGQQPAETAISKAAGSPGGFGSNHLQETVERIIKRPSPKSK